jgi:hypothetical protein
MCELACQAYYSEGSRDVYSFPRHVETYVQNGLGRFSDNGVGCLTVFDPYRVDVNMAIRTQDVVRLKKNGEFILLGRAESAPLKGCSLAFEDLFRKSPASNKKLISKERNTPSYSVDILTAYREFIASDTALDSWSEEFRSKPLAKDIQVDLLASLPDSPSAMDKILQTANADDIENEMWLLIPPSTHSVACLYPLFVLLCSGADVQIRLPNNKHISRLLQKLSASMGFLSDTRLSLLPATWHLSDTHKTDRNIFVFGANETIRYLAGLTEGKVVGFGSSIR